MKLREMEIFQAIMTTGSVTEAARHLNISQPAVSKMLRHMEDVIGFRLFVRRQGRLHPTAEAKALHPSVESIFGNIDTVEKIAQDLRDMRTGFIRVATIPTLGMIQLPKAVSSFLEGRPGVRIGIKILNAQQVVERVVNRQVDLGVVYAPAEDTGITVEELGTAEVVCVLPRTHPLAALRTIGPQNVQGLPLISINRASAIGALIDDAFRRCNVNRQSVVEVSHSFIAYSLVDAGVGIAVVDPFMAGPKYFPDLTIRPFRPRVSINPRVLYSEALPLSQLNRTFVDHLRNAVGLDGGQFIAGNMTGGSAIGEGTPETRQAPCLGDDLP